MSYGSKASLHAGIAVRSVAPPSEIVESMWLSAVMFGPGNVDEQAANKAYESMAATQKAMFQMQLEARRKIDAVLTKGQREQLSRYWSSR